MLGDDGCVYYVDWDDGSQGYTYVKTSDFLLYACVNFISTLPKETCCKVNDIHCKRNQSEIIH
jgi:hypothetical protein